jgi:hypothetical protein
MDNGATMRALSGVVSEDETTRVYINVYEVTKVN